MLLAALPWSMCTTADERHPVHKAAVQMIGEVVDMIVGKLNDAAEAEDANVEKEETIQAEFMEKQEELESLMLELRRAGDTRNARLKELKTDTEEKQIALVELREEEERGNPKLRDAREEKEALDEVFSGPFQKLRDMTFEDEEADNLLQEVQAIIDGMDLEASLVQTLPQALVKRDRGSFETLAISQFEERLTSQLAALEEKIQASTSEQKEAVKKVQAELDTAKEGVQIATRAVAKAEKARNGRQAELETFRDYNKAAFEMLRDRVSDKPQPPPAPPPAEAPAAAAAPAQEEPQAQAQADVPMEAQPEAPVQPAASSAAQPEAQAEVQAEAPADLPMEVAAPADE